MILGLLNSESPGIERLTNFRRSVLYGFPNGPAQLTALLSMLKEESTNDARFAIYEKRMPEQKSLTATANANGPFSTDGSTNSTVAGFNLANEGVIYLDVVDGTMFRVGHIIQITDVPNGAADAILPPIKAIVTDKFSANILKLRAIGAYTSLSNDTDANGLEVLVIGNAASEGQVGAALAPYQLPQEIYNYTQIHRTPFSFTGSVLKMGLKYDKTGPYQDKAKDATIQHGIEMEKSMFWGTRSVYIDPVTGLPTRTSGGLEYFLQQWELGTPYGVTASTLDTDDNKRIINNITGAMSIETYFDYMERLFQRTSTVAQEKLVYCGGGHLATINKMVAGIATINHNEVVKEKFGWDVYTLVTPNGQVHFIQHPLFTGSLRYTGVYLDVWNLIYRFLDGRDTCLLKNRQPNNADYREDEFLGETGLEVRYPESHMIIRNLREVL